MPSESTDRHRRESAALGPVRAAVLTVSDTRTPETDTSGRIIREMLVTDGHQVVFYSVLKDEPEPIQRQVLEFVDSRQVDVILTNGGTGIAPRDGTFEALDAILEKRLPGFGEIFRVLSYEEVGPAAMLSRAVAGLRGKTLVFTMPGSTNAVTLAMRKLILPELRHLVYEMKGRG